MPGVIILTVQSYLQIRYLTFRNIRSLRNADSIEVSNIKHELKMWKNTDRSISAISKFDDISRSVIHSRVVLLNEALERELKSDHEQIEHHTAPLSKNISFYLSDKKVYESQSEVENVDDVYEEEKVDKHEELTRRLEEMVNYFDFIQNVLLRISLFVVSH